jgi:hypothetical protein
MKPRRKSPGAPQTPHRKSRPDDANAFLPDGATHARDPLSERLAEGYLEAVTSGEEAEDERLDGNVPEEIGGPFIETSAAEELADDVDETNPEDATREPIPRAVGADPTPGRDVDELNERGRRTSRR